MKVLVQNLQKKSNLASELFDKYNYPDVILAQEINLGSETKKDILKAHNTSNLTGYGTAIGTQLEVSNVKLVNSPYPEFGGTIYKKTTIATIINNSSTNNDNGSSSIEFVSFHGYNGQPFKKKEKLVAHIDAVLSKLEKDTTSMFAGDFNTWSQGHLDAISAKLAEYGFHHVYSWQYPGRTVPLDHVYIRNLKVIKAETYICEESDHNGAILEVVVVDEQQS